MKVYFSICIAFLIAFPSVRAQQNNQERILINEIRILNGVEDSLKLKRRKGVQWIEFYNPTRKKIKVEDLFLTNNPKNPTLWKITPKPTGWEKFIKDIKMVTFFFWTFNSNVIGRKKTYAAFVMGKGYRLAGGIIPDFNKESDTLYLFRKIDNTLIAQDTVVIPATSEPFARLPDGEEFSQAEVLTPGLPNLTKRDAVSKREAGLCIHGGVSNIYGKEFNNTNFPRLAYSIGYFRRKNLGFAAVESGLRFSVRGFHIKSETSITTVTATRSSETEGMQTNKYLDFPLLIVVNATQRWNVFTGITASFLIRTKYEYDTKYTTTFLNTGLVKESTTHYVSNDFNEAYDVVDLSASLGIRYRWAPGISSSLYIIADFFGLQEIKQDNKGVFITMEMNLINSFIKVKRKKLFGN